MAYFQHGIQSKMYHGVRSDFSTPVTEYRSGISGTIM
jgi:hypothetical protein